MFGYTEPTWLTMRVILCTQTVIFIIKVLVFVTYTNFTYYPITFNNYRKIYTIMATMATLVHVIQRGPMTILAQIKKVKIKLLAQIKKVITGKTCVLKVCSISLYSSCVIMSQRMFYFPFHTRSYHVGISSHLSS